MALQEQSHLLSFSVERLLQQSRRHSKSSSTCESPSSTPPSSPPLLLSQPREIMVNAGVTALPLSFGMPLSSTTTWNPAFNAWSVLGLPMAYKPLVNSTWNFQPSSIQQQSLSLLNTKKKMDHTDIAQNDDEVEDEDSCSDTSPEPSSPTSDDAIVMDSGPIEDKTSKKYKKKKRTTFTSSQLQQLESRFSQQKYLTKVDRCRLAQMIGLTEKHVKTWYQNRRTKWKRDCTDEVWSREREHAATNMYTQHLQMKTVNSSLQSSSKPYTLVNV